ncbi:MAG: hypothetical protein RR909_04360 [Bacilli bacterium]
MNCEVIDDIFLAMMLGATKGGDGTLSVTGSVPNQSFTAEGTFRQTSLTGDAYKKIKFFNLKAQVSADLTLSAKEISSFSLVLDILADDSGKIMDVTDVVSGAGVSEPQLTSIFESEQQ